MLERRIWVERIQLENNIAMADNNIKVFISYSWETNEHNTWVLKFASDLRRHGVDVILDQWDARLGDDLAFFMEQGLTSSNLVLCICSEQYVQKANTGTGGAGYEKRILSAEMINGDNRSFIIPIIKNNQAKMKVPTFLSGIKYEDFDKNDYYSCYRNVLARICNEDLNAKPPLGHNPFDVSAISETISINLGLAENEFYNPSMSGVVSFDYKRHDGIFSIGSGVNEFATMWSEAGFNCIHCYKDKVFRLGYKANCHDFPKLEDITTEFDFSSRAKCVKVDEVVVLENNHHRFAALKVLKVNLAPSDIGHLVEFEYCIY